MSTDPEQGIRSMMVGAIHAARAQPDIAQTTYQRLGIDAPGVRLQGGQSSVADLKPGDLVGWKGGQKPDGGYVGNVAVYAGDNKIVENYFGNNRTRALRPDDNTFGMPVVLPEDTPGPHPLDDPAPQT